MAVGPFSSQVNILPSLKSNYSNVFYGKFKHQGDVLLTEVGKTPWKTLELVNDGAFGKIYKGYSEREVYGQPPRAVSGIPSNQTATGDQRCTSSRA